MLDGRDDARTEGEQDKHQQQQSCDGKAILGERQCRRTKKGKVVNDFGNWSDRQRRA